MFNATDTSPADALTSAPALSRTAAQTLAEQLADRFAARIRDRLLAPGARLPSVRQCAAQQGLSPSTVVAAYDLLLAQGLVQAQRYRGFFVRERTPLRGAGAGRAVPAPGAEVPDRMAAPVNAAALIRGMFHPAGSRPQPGMGAFPPDWMVSTFMQAAVRRVTTGPALADNSLRYGEPLGDGQLRRVLADRLQVLGLPAGPQQIITTVGATHALDIVSRTLLKAGDSVMVEEPGWAVEFARLAAMGMRILPVPRGPAGPDLAVMARYCEEHAPKLFVSVSVLHNPTGYSLSPASAHRVLQLAQQHGFYVVEDDTYGHIAPEHATRMSVLDGLQRTIYVSGFAKILAPNWRVGYLVAPPDWVERLLDTKLLTTLTTPSLLERALAHCIEQGQLRRHAERIRSRLDEARGRSVKLAQAAGCRFVSEPAGLFGWVDTGVDTEALAQRMLDQGYLIAPGSLFHAARAPSTLMRINFATTQDAAFWTVFKRLAAAR
ncbi:PLP-dependent aminotransferase family protein [Hydrogenophaga sp.]|jgi:DNA-binding transcriptional MocR family regulator|uniref:aminotransferase-like domain-containing protein n=2 Tax=Hydrogenophaga sp. TaxID=1904254 RepID=UPI002715AFF0|nr:PLP-dependent aminotransferase family protein [Hydrogenophaga sp.]MDO9253804.1 PLP-dependent aminotransferase family protein [Hydrogenophaga sp.]MDP3887760.1 PLP-dependent aminotransferase family protein [Hydrogenophaga sp.]